MSNIVIGDFIKPNKNFQTSINIAFDLGDEDKISSFIPTTTACHYIEELLQSIMVKTSQRAKMLVGAYGKGKSHITLITLAAMSIKKPELFTNLVEAYRQQNSRFSDSFASFVEDGPRLLPVIIQGNSSDIARSLLYALRSALRNADLEELMPQTSFSGALETICRWRIEFPATYQQLEDILEQKGSAIEEAIKDYDSATYYRFIDAYPQLTAGSTFDPLADADVIDIYNQVLNRLVKNGYSGIYVVYDEFSKYLESSLDRATIEDIKLLQDFAEACNRSTQDRQLHLLLISHKNLSNYIDAQLPKEKVDGWRGVSGRFEELELFDNSDQSYELISSAIMKDPIQWEVYLKDNEEVFNELKNHYVKTGLINYENANNVVLGCFPLHPTTTFLLPRVSEIVAQNERTLFMFLSAEESRSLPQRAVMEGINLRFITPDFLYDYFEPQMRKEHYLSSAHNMYTLAHGALAKVEDSSLEARIIKTIAIIGLVSQYDRLAPTYDVIVKIFQDAGYTTDEIKSALEHLIEYDSIAYLNRSNSQIKLKESSGVNIDEAIENEAKRLMISISVEDILNEYESGKALYPSRHNAKHCIVRYFDCRFERASTVIDKLKQNGDFLHTGDGVVIAVIVDDPESLQEVMMTIRQFGKNYPTTVFVLPKFISNIQNIAFRYAAALKLKDEARDDEVLFDEYNIVLEDCTEILSKYIANYFCPERKKANYFIQGVQKYRVTHRKKLSALLSDLCDEVYYLTPIINNEMINKNEPTGTALTNRSKILMALCARNLEPNLGFIGNGQESSIMRSVLGITGVIENLSTDPVLRLDSTVSTVKSITDTIKEFFLKEDGANFALLYDKLMLPKYHIGAKRGPIPIFIALILRDFRDTICIMRDGEERPIDKTTIEDIDSSPEKFTLKLLEWNMDKAEYISAIGHAFGQTDEVLTKNQVTDGIRSWYVALPQFTRNSHIDHSDNLGSQFDENRIALFKAISQTSSNPNEFLFESLPNAFNSNWVDPGLTDAIQIVIEHCNDYIADSLVVLSQTIQDIISPHAAEGESVSSSISNWLDALSSDSKHHLYSGVNNQIMLALNDFTPDIQASMKQLTKAVTSLRIEDWDDHMYNNFIDTFTNYINEVNTYEFNIDNIDDQQSITFIGENGEEESLSFDFVECSPRANLLKNQIIAAIDEMGQSISISEKRQVVFDILRSIC